MKVDDDDEFEDHYEYHDGDVKDKNYCYYCYYYHPISITHCLHKSIFTLLGVRHHWRKIRQKHTAVFSWWY